MPLRSLLAALLLAAGLLMPSAAVAEHTSFSPLPEAPTEQAPPPPPAPGTDDGLSSRQQLLIAAAGIVLLFGIGWAILRDARRRAPADERPRTADGSTAPKATKPPPKRRAQQSRTKARAARQARKRNR